MRHFWTVLFGLVALIPHCKGLTVTCNECTCPPGTADVTCRGLNSMPTFGAELHNRKVLDMASNIILHLPDDAFKGMVNLIEIDLTNNSILTIGPHAFRGLPNLIRVSLRNNNISSFPNFADITDLQVLDISQNPIPASAFPDVNMRHLGSTLQEFHFGHDSALHRWPQQTSHLQRLERLELSGSTMAYLQPTAFRGFENRLKELTIQRTQLQATPLLSRLRYLEKLHLDNNPFTDYGVLENSFENLNNLKELSLRSDELTKFPIILHHLPKLQVLSLDGNAFYFISDSAVNIINNSSIISLSLRNCGLDRIPGSISNDTLYKLGTLDLSYNNIVSIEKHDLNNLGSLKNLSFAGNPLQYVSAEALNLISVTDIDLSHTNLVSIPKALKNMPNLRRLKLEQNGVECTCDLVWFGEYRHVKDGYMDISGECETVLYSIDYYLHSLIHNCLDYASS